MSNRKCLGVLQPNVQSQSHLLVSSSGNLALNTPNRGKKRKNSENLVSAKCKRKDGIYTDTAVKKPVKLASVSVQTEPSLSCQGVSVANTDSTDTASPHLATDMLTSDTPPTEYWEALAEKRREALEEALTENQNLHEENKNLQDQVSKLKEENKLLEDMVEEAKDLATLVQSITGVDDDPA